MIGNLHGLYSLFFPLFPVVQRLIKFVENVSSRTNIFKNKIVKIEENHSQRPSLHRFHTFCNFLDALASLKTMLDSDSATDVFKISRLQSITEYYRVLQSVTECYRVLQSVGECYIVLQSIT